MTLELAYNVWTIVFWYVFVYLLANLAVRIVLDLAVLIARLLSPRAAIRLQTVRRFLLRIWVTIICLLGAATACQFARHVFDRFTDYNPSPLDASMLIGNWVRGSSVLNLVEGGQVSCEGSFTVSGGLSHGPYQWSLDTQEGVVLLKESRDKRVIARLKVLRFNNKLRLCDDFDWDEETMHSLGYTKDGS